MQRPARKRAGSALRSVRFRAARGSPGTSGGDRLAAAGQSRLNRSRRFPDPWRRAPGSLIRDARRPWKDRRRSMTRDLAQYVEVNHTRGTTILKVVDPEVLADEKAALYALADGEAGPTLSNQVVLSL